MKMLRLFFVSFLVLFNLHNISSQNVNFENSPCNCSDNSICDDLNPCTIDFIDLQTCNCVNEPWTISLSIENSDDCDKRSIKVVGNTNIAQSYSWANGQSSQEIFNLTPGNYCVTVVNTTGCSISECLVVDECNSSQCTVGQPCDDGNNCTYNDVIVDSETCLCQGEEKSISIPQIQNHCDNTTVNALVNTSGLVEPVTYSWSNGATTQQIIVDENATTTQNKKYTYSTTVTDADGCNLSTSQSFVVKSIPDVTVNVEYPNCESKGQICFDITDNSDRTGIQFSLDGGQSFSGCPDNIGTKCYEVEDGEYNLVTRWGNQECPVNLGIYSVNISDEDDDGVCDAEDVCPGFDDNQDENGNGIPDGCEETTANIENLCKFFSLMQGLDISYPNVSVGIWEVDENTIGRALDSLNTSFEAINQELSQVDELYIDFTFLSGDEKVSNSLVQIETDIIINNEFVQKWVLNLENQIDFDSLYSNLIVYVGDDKLNCSQDELILLIDSEDVELPELKCGETFTVDIENQDVNTELEDGEIIYFNNFPILLTQVAQGSDGITNGKGVLALPFGPKQVLVEIKDVYFNNQNVALPLDNNGFVKASSGNMITQLPQLDIPEIDIDAKMCIPPPPPAGISGGGVDPVTGLDGYGFDKNGIHSVTGTPYNPGGFDVNGVHNETGTTYNEAGCTIDNVHHETGEPCDVSTPDPYILTLFKDTISLEKPFKAVFQSYLENLQSKVTNKNNECSQLKSELESLTPESLRELYFGEGNALIEPELSNLFHHAPQKFSYGNRYANKVEIEEKHIDLYYCDDSLQYLIAYQDAVNSKNPSVPENCTPLEDYILNALDQIDTTTFNLIQDPEKLDSWLLTIILEYLSANCELPSYTSVDLPGLKEPEFDGIDHYNSIAALDELQFVEYSGTELEKIKFEYQQEFDEIRGIPRPYITEAIYNAKQQLIANGAGFQNALPIAINNEVGGYKYTVLIDNIEISLDGGAVLDAAIVITDPNSGRKTAFAAEGISFGTDGIQADAKLILVSDSELRINNTAKIVLKGANNKTFVEWDCNGFKQVSLDARVEFCSEIIKPIVDSTGVVLENIPYSFDFEGTYEKWMEFTVSAAGKPFVITSAEDYKWQVDSLKFDFSSTKPSSALAPIGYKNDFYNETTKTFAPEWKGFVLEGLRVKFTQNFTNSGGAITAGITSAIIDNNGFSAEIFAEEELVSLENGNMSGWGMSMNQLHVIFLQNHIAGGGFGGLMDVSLLEKPIKYSATIVKQNTYGFKIEPGENNGFPVFKAIDVDLKKNSSIKAQYDPENGFIAVADLSGSLSIDTTSSMKDLVLPSVEFQNLRVSNKQPYLDGGKWGISGLQGGTSPGWKLFAVTIDSIRPYSNGPNDEISLGVDFSIDIIKGQVAASGGIDINGNLEIGDNERQKWKYKNVSLREFCVDAEYKNVFSLSGCVQFYQNKPTFGDGWRGGFTLEIKKGFTNPLGVRSVGQFGTTANDHDYFFLDMLVSAGNGINIGPITVTSLGGGVSKGMYPNFANIRPENLGGWIESGAEFNFDGIPLGTTITGIPYEPNENYGLEFKLLADYSIGPKKIAHGNAELLFRFNSKESGGGLGEIEFRASAKLLEPISTEDIVPGLSSGLKNIQIPNFQNQDSSKVSTDNFPPNTLEARLSGFISMKMNFNTNIFSGDLAIYLKGGGITGAGNNDALGWASLYFAPNKWYIWVGTPTNPCGVELKNVPGIKARTTAYFDIGTDIPPFPGLPARVKHLSKDLNISEALRSAGTGFAFGAALEVGLDLNLVIAQAELRAGCGFDIMMRKYQNVTCNGSTDFGINQWYATGQLWAYIDGRLKAFGFNVASAGVAALVQVQAPNPVYIHGAVDFYYKTPIGSGNKNISIEINKDKACNFQPEKPDNIDMIASMSPENGQTGVETSIRPQVEFIYRLDQTLKVNDTEYTFEIDTDQTGLYQGDRLVCKGELHRYGKTYNFIPPDFIDGNDSFKIKMVLNIFKDGVEHSVQIKEHVFHTSGDLEFIPDGNIKYTYPTDGMLNFHKEEYDEQEGFIQLIKGQPSLFEDREVYARVCNSNNQCFETKAKYYPGNKLITFPLPTESLQNETFYKLNLISKEVNLTSNEEVYSSGGSSNRIAANFTNETNEEFEITSDIFFRTSKYSTFKQKVNQLSFNENQVSTNRGEVLSKPYCYLLDLNGDELLDYFDNQPNLFAEIRANTSISAAVYLFYPSPMKTPTYDDIKDYSFFAPIDLYSIGSGVDMLGEIPEIANEETFESNQISSLDNQRFGFSDIYANVHARTLLIDDFKRFFNEASEITGKTINPTNQRIWLGDDLYDAYTYLLADSPKTTDTKLKIMYVLPDGTKTYNSSDYSSFQEQWQTTQSATEYLDFFD